MAVVECPRDKGLGRVAGFPVVSLRSTTATREGKRGQNDLIDISLSPQSTRIRFMATASHPADRW